MKTIDQMTTAEFKAEIDKAWMRLPFHERHFRAWRLDGCPTMSKENVDALYRQRELEDSSPVAPKA
jgi:hypothetical protein